MPPIGGYVMLLGIVVAVAAILLGGLTDMSIGVVAIYVLAGATSFTFLQSSKRPMDGAARRRR